MFSYGYLHLVTLIFSCRSSAWKWNHWLYICSCWGWSKSATYSYMYELFQCVILHPNWLQCCICLHAYCIQCLPAFFFLILCSTLPDVFFFHFKCASHKSVITWHAAPRITNLRTYLHFYKDIEGRVLLEVHLHYSILCCAVQDWHSS